MTVTASPPRCICGQPGKCKIDSAKVPGTPAEVPAWKRWVGGVGGLTGLAWQPVAVVVDWLALTGEGASSPGTELYCMYPRPSGGHIAFLAAVKRQSAAWLGLCR